MMKQLYRIYLEDYSYPRSISMVKPYYGTMDEIINLMAYLSESMGTSMRYQETIGAVEYCRKFAVSKHSWRIAAGTT